MERILKVRKFLSLNRKTMMYLIEAFLYLGWARVLLMRPFIKVAPGLGRVMEETPKSDVGLSLAVLTHVSESIDIMSHHTYWKSQCFVRAIAAMKMLERRQIPSTLYLGTARDEEGRMIAHAWLRSGSHFISGIEGMERFTVVSHFANWGKN